MKKKDLMHENKNQCIEKQGYHDVTHTHHQGHESASHASCITVVPIFNHLEGEQMEEIMKSLCIFFPSLLLQSKLFKDSLMLKIPASGKKPHQFIWRCLQRHELTQSKRR